MKVAALCALVLCMPVALAAAPAAGPILFPRDTVVPRPVQDFAWRVIETRCNYQSFERDQRSFWAYDARAHSVPSGVVYSIAILSELAWKKSEPPAVIEMTVVDDGRLRLETLKSSFITCAR